MGGMKGPVHTGELNSQSSNALSLIELVSFPVVVYFVMSLRDFMDYLYLPCTCVKCHFLT